VISIKYDDDGDNDDDFLSCRRRRYELDSFSERVQTATDCRRLNSHRPTRRDSFVASRK